MKKLPKINLKKNRRPSNDPKRTIPSRITNETVAEHRERILAGGRRFKYPMQYGRARLVRNALIFGFFGIIIIVLLGLQQLYLAQNTSTFMYRITQVLPLPVAKIDGQSVPYSDYLMYYNSSAHYLRQAEQVDFTSKDGKRQQDYIKRESLDNAEADALALKLANEQDISVTHKQVDDFINSQRDTANGRISLETYNASTLDVLGWTPLEYRRVFTNKILRREVSFAVDDTAKSKAVTAAKLIRQEDVVNLEAIAGQLGGEGNAKSIVGTSGFVPKENRDGGLAAAAATLTKGQVSDVIKATTGDGYYFVKLIDSNDTQVSYQYLQIPLTTFTSRLAELKMKNSIKEYITLTQSKTTHASPSTDN